MRDKGDYVVVIDGALGVEVRAAFEPLLVTVAGDTSTVHAPGIDQPGLHGVLDRAAALGLTLRAVQRLDTEG